MRDWFEDHLTLIFCVVCIVIIIGAVAFGCMCDLSGEFDIVKWTTNPTNPASPLHP
jgi:hypothetical protein